MSETQVPAGLEDRIRLALHERAEALRTSEASFPNFDRLPPGKPSRGRPALVAVAVLTVAAVSVGLWVGFGRSPAPLVRTTPTTSRSPQELVNAGLFTQTDFPTGYAQRPMGPQPHFSTLGSSCRKVAAALQRATAGGVSSNFFSDTASASDDVTVFSSTGDAKAVLSSVQGSGAFAPPCLNKALNAAEALAFPPGSGVTFFPGLLTRQRQVRFGDQTIAYETSINSASKSGGYLALFDEVFTRVNRVVVVSFLYAGAATIGGPAMLPRDELGSQVRAVIDRLRALTGPARLRAPTRPS